MKKLKLLVAPLIGISFLASCGGNKKPEPEPEQKSLLPIRYSNYDVDTDTSEVTLWETIDYEYTDSGLVKKETYDWPDDDDVKIIEYTYDSHNNVNIEKETNIAGGEETQTVTIYTNEYDEEGHLLVCQTTVDGEPTKKEEYTYESNYSDWDTYKLYSLEGGSESLLNHFSHKFDEETGHVISEVNEFTGSHDDYTWDKYGCNILIEMYTINQTTTSEELFETIEYSYYKNNPDKVSKSVVTTYNPATHSTDVYTYDSYDRLTKIDYLNNEDEVFSRDVYEYAD